MNTDLVVRALAAACGVALVILWVSSKRAIGSPDSTFVLLLVAVFFFWLAGQPQIRFQRRARSRVDSTNRTRR